MSAKQLVFVVDDDVAVRDSLVMLLKLAGYEVNGFESAASFLKDDGASKSGCLIADIRMPDMDGLELQQELIKRQSLLRVIVITGHGDVPLAVQAMKAGAVDFLEKPFAHDVLVASIKRALDESAKAAWSAGAADEVENRLNLLTKREREVFAGVVAGKMSKTIAYELGSSVRTVEIHRARMMNKMQASNMQELIRMALALKKQ